MKARRSLIPLALFALAFVGSLFALKRATPDAAAPAKVVAVAPLMRVAAAPMPQTEAAVSSPVAEPPAAAAAQHATSPAAPSAAPAIDEPPAADVAPLPTVPFEGVGGAADALRHSSNPAERVRAIQSLAQSAREGHEVSRVRFMLQRAGTGDEDPDVAERAREAYEQLVEREDR